MYNAIRDTANEPSSLSSDLSEEENCDFFYNPKEIIHYDALILISIEKASGYFEFCIEYSARDSLRASKRMNMNIGCGLRTEWKWNTIKER